MSSSQRRVFQDRSNMVVTNLNKSDKSTTVKKKVAVGQQIIFRSRPPFQNINKLSIPQLHFDGSKSTDVDSSTPNSANNGTTTSNDRNSSASMHKKGLVSASGKRNAHRFSSDAKCNKMSSRHRGKGIKIYGDTDVKATHGTHFQVSHDCIVVDFAMASPGTTLKDWVVSDPEESENDSSTKSLSMLFRCSPERFQHFQKAESLLLDVNNVEERITSSTFWFLVIREFAVFKKELEAVSEPSKQLSLLFGFSHCIYLNDNWLIQHGRGWGGDVMIATLAKHWKTILGSNTPDALEVDLGISYPTLLTFLKQFKAKVEEKDMRGDPPLRFDYF